MKKVRNIGLILGLILLISSTGKAQYYYTSFGNVHDWRLPKYIQYSIYDSYYGYDIAHVHRFHRYGHHHYNVLLHRNGWFVELRFDRHGHIYKTIRHRHHYPLLSHSCTNHCGYHRAYYKTYYPKYHSHHKTVYINTHHHGHHEHHNNYYTNIYVEKQHKQYNGHARGNRNTQTAHNNNVYEQRRRTSTTIRKPPVNKTGTFQPTRSQSSNRSRYESGQRSAGRISNSDSDRNLIVYRNKRGERNR
ncbi:MAG: hypothetical protein MI975_08110 [Cytophagales bacterium]|nr:hypothetical protein [Cytophagales bacterium]